MRVRDRALVRSFQVAVVVSALAAGRVRAQGAPSMSGTQAAPNTLTPEERRAGWRLLFDGRTTEGWRSYKSDSMPGGWQAVDGALTRVARAGNIITKEAFRNFELLLDWKVPPNGNSGVFYRAALGSEAIYFSAPEMQVLDDAGHADGQSEFTSAGSVHSLYPTPRGIVKPAGEWNSARILANGNHVEHWLNGQRIAAYELGSADWLERVAKSKFAQWPEYGKSAEGYIGLQDHGDSVAFRNIKIRVIP